MYSKSNSSGIIMVEGNIGAGKSTFLKVLKKRLNLNIIFEPTDKWQNKNEKDGNLLKLFYADTPRWAYTFQSYAFITRTQTLLDYQAENQSDKIKVLERSVYCDRYCFAKNCFESGLMTKLEWQIYKDWFSWLVEKYSPKPIGFIYLQTSPETCYSRINKRKRSEESEIPLDYLQKLHKRHEDWLFHKKGITRSLSDIPILILDCNKEFETNLKNQFAFMEQVQQFINQITQIPTKTQKKSIQKQL